MNEKKLGQLTNSLEYLVYEMIPGYSAYIKKDLQILVRRIREELKKDLDILKKEVTNE